MLLDSLTCFQGSHKRIKCLGKKSITIIYLTLHLTKIISATSLFQIEAIKFKIHWALDKIIDNIIQAPISIVTMQDL